MMKVGSKVNECWNGSITGELNEHVQTPFDFG